VDSCRLEVAIVSNADHWRWHSTDSGARYFADHQVDWSLLMQLTLRVVTLALVLACAAAVWKEQREDAPALTPP